jgi:4'-phosphopantetheinyl transferase EntD
MLGGLLPEAVRWAETTGNRDDVVLFPEERAAIAKAVPKRRAEFTAARACAREALAALGVPPAPLVPGERGAPTWPAGTVGSMTHCRGYRAAVAARAWEVATLGIDAEPHDVLPSGVLDVVACPEDVDGLARLPGRDVAWDRLLFSAKEAVYKAWFPLTHRWLDFNEAVVTIDPAGTFDARLLVPGPEMSGTRLAGFTGRWAASPDLLVTVVVVPAWPAGGPLELT